MLFLTAPDLDWGGKCIRKQSGLGGAMQRSLLKAWQKKTWLQVTARILLNIWRKQSEDLTEWHNVESGEQVSIDIYNAALVQ